MGGMGLHRHLQRHRRPDFDRAYCCMHSFCYARYTTLASIPEMSGQDANAEAALNNRSIVPTSPFEIQATQDLLQQRIENGQSLYPLLSRWTG